jgi:hypothetical protein
MLVLGGMVTTFRDIWFLTCMAVPPGLATRIFEKNVSTLKGFVNRTKILPLFTLAVPFSAKKQACGPEARAFRPFFFLTPPPGRANKMRG